MAVDSGAAPTQILKSPKRKEPESQQLPPLTSAPKRNKAPGIRLVGCRIYDSVNGKTCHQCRQKTRDFSAACKSMKNNKPCPIMFCHKCLLNRYGEKAEEVDALGEWSCPRCRGICNCSICMKKRGHQPTGILINTAKSIGYSSVSEMLLKGSEQLKCENGVAVIPALPKKAVAPSPRKRGKENSLDGKVDENLPNGSDRKSKKVKEFHKGSKDDATSISHSPHKRNLDQEANAEDTGSCGTKKSKKVKINLSDELNNKKDDDEKLKVESVNDGEKKPKKSSKRDLKHDDSKKGDVALARRTTVTRKNLSKPLKNDTTNEDGNITANAQVDLPPNIPLPLGTELSTVAGIDVSTEDVGDALQFLEFCAAFGKILEVKKGQPENVLRDLFHGRTGRRGKFSVTVQFHIHLLSILQAEEGEECGELSPSVGKNSWFDALKECLSQSQSILKALGLECLEKASDYESLKASEKLKLLNILCDEILNTEKIRSWMEKQNKEHAEKVKEARKEVIAARAKEKTLRQKMKDDVAKAIIARQGAPLSIAEHEAIVSHIKNKAEAAHANVLESKGTLLENTRICNSVTIEPLLVGHGGNAYWKLNSSGHSNILHQDVGKGDTLTLNEKWYAIDDEGKDAIEKHICSLREKGKRQRCRC